MASDMMASGPSSIIDPLAPEQTYTATHPKKDTHLLPTVEDALDDSDVEHPPPSAHLPAANPTDDNGPVFSETADGNQVATDGGNADASAPKPTAKLDVSSEEAFPALGGPKSRPAASNMSWGRKPTNSGTNGVNGAVNGKSSTRASTSATAKHAPVPMLPPAFKSGGGAQVALPGRHSDYIQFAPSELIPPQQLKTSRKEIINEINRRSKAKIEVKPGGAGNTTKFVGTGSPEAVREALREVASKLGSKQSIVVPVPASVRAHIIGRQGATIQNIMKRTGARIQVPKQGAGEEPEDDETSIEITVEGDAIACGLARREIESIANEKTSNVSLKMRDIPPEYFPFLAGPRNSRLGPMEQGRNVRVQIPLYHQWNGEAPTLPAPGQPATFNTSPHHHIVIAGDRQQAQQVQAELERQHEQLRQQLTLDQLSVERGRHQFIFGNRGPSLHDFLEETGCSLILPPPGDDSEILTVVGPADKLEAAKEKVMDLAMSMAVANVDIGKAHVKSPGYSSDYARSITRYLRERPEIAQLESAHNISIVCPDCRVDAPTPWEVYAAEHRGIIPARTEIMNFIQAHPPRRMRLSQVDPFFHPHIQQQYARQIREDHGVHVIFPKPSERQDFPDLLLVYEDAGTPAEYVLPRRQPSPAEVNQFGKALQEAEQTLLALIAGQSQLAQHDINANPKFHDKVRRFADRQQAGLSSEKFPVQLQFMQPSSENGHRNLRVLGPTPAADDLATAILDFLEQEEKDEKERGFTTSFDFPSAQANFLIGKRGENINALRQEFDVDIQVKDGKVELKGPQAKCEACKQSILKSLAKWQDEVDLKCIISPEFHREIIGAKGSGVNRLQDRYGVRINFPKNSQASDDTSESGSVRNAGKKPILSSEVTIRGPRKGADAAKDELLSLFIYLRDNAHTAEVSVTQDQVPRLIGQGGREMEALRAETGCSVDIPSPRDVAAGQRVVIKLKGAKENVLAAKKKLEEKVKQFDDIVSKTVDVDKKHHKGLIGSNGANIRAIVERAGGPPDSAARTVRFPPPGSSESTIRVEGSSSVVDAIVKELTAFAHARANQVTSSLPVPRSQHHLLIGRGGDSRRAIESQFNVTLDVPKRDTQGDAAEQIKITGQPADIEKAKAHIDLITKNQDGTTILVPASLHHHIADNGQFFRRLRGDHQVVVSHGPEVPLPPRPDSAPGQAGAALPLITEEVSQEQGGVASWELRKTRDGVPEGREGPTIPWILRPLQSAPPEALARAESHVRQALEAAKKPGYTGYLALRDPRSNRYVVGQLGAGVSMVRAKTGCQVKVPKAGATDRIEISGGEEEVSLARDLILRLVEEGEEGRRRRHGE